MNSRFPHVKRLAGMAAMATLVATAGWGLASGTAKADVAHPDDYRCYDSCFHDHDRGFDRGRDFRGFFDDHRDRGFFDDHRDRGFFNPFFGFGQGYR